MTYVSCYLPVRLLLRVGWSTFPYGTVAGRVIEPILSPSLLIVIDIVSIDNTI